MLPRSGGAMTPSRPSTRRTTRSSVSTSTVSPAWTTEPLPRAPIAPSSADHDPMSDQPTSIAAMTTAPLRAALSITAWSIEIARWIDS